MTTTMRLCLATTMLATAALLSACGGGSDPAPLLPAEPANTVPTSATASLDAFTAFTDQLIRDANGSNTAQPLQMNDAASPTSESAVPTPVI